MFIIAYITMPSLFNTKFGYLFGIILFIKRTTDLGGDVTLTQAEKIPLDYIIDFTWHHGHTTGKKTNRNKSI